MTEKFLERSPEASYLMPAPFAFHIQYIMQQRNTSARLWFEKSEHITFPYQKWPYFEERKLNGEYLSVWVK